MSVSSNMRTDGIRSRLARLQPALPTLPLTRLAGALAASRTGWLKNLLIRGFSRRYAVDWSEIEAAGPHDFASFNDFFTRPLKPGARPLQYDPEALLSPCDGIMGTSGAISASGLMLQVKHIDYPLQALLGCRAGEAGALHGATYRTLYLAPADYHRVHMPAAGELTAWTHIPGRLFAVAPASAASLPRLFCRNERVVCYFRDRQRRTLILILVGAMLVGGIETVWHGRFRHAAGRQPLHYRPDAPLCLEQGAELGRFLMGSTVIVIAPAGYGGQPPPAGTRIRLHQPL